MIKYVIALILMLVSAQAFSEVFVRGYYRKDGTYVQPHTRTNPDGIKWNNKSYKGV